MAKLARKRSSGKYKTKKRYEGVLIMAVSVDLLIKIVFTYACVITGLLSLVFIFVPVFPFIAARISKNHVPLFLISGSRIKIVLGKYFAGTLKTSKDGVFRETPGSGYLLKKIMCYFGWSNYGATLPADYPSVIQALKEKGYAINTYEDLKKIWDHKPEEAGNLIKFGDKEISFASLKKEVIEYAPGKTLILGDLQYKFPCNDNPFINEAKEAAELTIERMQKGKNYLLWLIILGGIVIIAYIAYSLFKNFSAGPAIDVICQCPSFLGNLTGEIKL